MQATRTTDHWSLSSFRTVDRPVCRGGNGPGSTACLGQCNIVDGNIPKMEMLTEIWYRPPLRPSSGLQPPSPRARPLLWRAAVLATGAGFRVIVLPAPVAAACRLGLICTTASERVSICETARMATERSPDLAHLPVASSQNVFAV